ncbi:Phox-like protein [Pseudohyphozyma bogoriensis]|nr:Phox-like protein [Pseudohyphozyma bogoriensis]
MRRKPPVATSKPPLSPPTLVEPSASTARLSDSISEAMLGLSFSPSPSRSSSLSVDNNDLDLSVGDLRRNRSFQELGIPSGFSGAMVDDAADQQQSRSDRVGGRGSPGAGNGKGKERQESVAHPFKDSPQLLRRCTSLLSLEAAGEEDQVGSDDESEFASDRNGVRIEDRSDHEAANFARDGATIRTLKRYSAFVKLRNDLMRTFPRLKYLIPPLPPKSGFAKFRPSFLERRRQQLCYWLTIVLLHPQTGCSGIVRAWVTEKSH